MNSFIRERIYYEIAMSIGNSLDLSVMLKEGLSTYLRKLNCLAGAVLKRVEEADGLTSFESVYAIPKRMTRNSAVKEAIERIPSRMDDEALAAYMAQLPIVETSHNLRRYLMELPGFGLLLLVKSAQGLARHEIKSLSPLNVKLAGACISCTANERLHREIADRERAEEKYRAIFNNAVEGIFQSTLDGRPIEVNPSMAHLLGYDSPEDVMENLTNLGEQLYVHSEERHRFLERLNRKGHVSGFEIEYKRRDGSTGWLAVSARLMFDEAGAPVRVEGAAVDITVRKQVVIALREAKNEAERLSQMKSSFLSMVSHELRTPLTAILGFAKITRKRMREILSAENTCPPEITHGLDRIKQNTEVIIVEGERLTELINNVLDLAKLEAGWFEWSMRETSVNLVLNHSLAATEVLFSNAKVAVVDATQENLPMVNGDHDRLVQVAINLLSNAAKFTEEGMVTLGAAVENDEVVVRVIDTGPGVPEEQKDVIFDKFRQLGHSLTDKPKGTGLGLPISKEIVEHHGGRIWIEPNPDGGSIFAFALPVKK